jgi:hypothetical protein
MGANRRIVPGRESVVSRVQAVLPSDPTQGWEAGWTL